MLNIFLSVDFFWREGKEVIMQQEIITSLDIGSKKLSAAMAVKGKDDEIEILGVEFCKSAGVEKGLLTDIEKCRVTVNDLLKTLEEKTRRNIKDISIGISSRKVRITETTVEISLEDEKVTGKDLRRALEKGEKNIAINDYEIVIDSLINFYVLDGKVMHKEILNWKGKKLELNLTFIIAEAKEIQKYYELFKGTNYNVKYIKLNVISGKQVFLNDKNAMGEIALVDIGAGVVDIALFSGDIIKNISNIPIGGNNISNDLAICGGFSFLEADNIKKIYAGNCRSLFTDNSIPDKIRVGTIDISRKLFYEVTNARIEEILNHVNIELKKTGHYDRICSIILYGDGVSYFEDINETVDNIFERKTKVITKTDLGIKNSENITSLAIVKEVYDRLNLLGDNSKVPIDESKKISETENLHNNEGGNHVLKKIKCFFEKIF
ncbi:cell division protein FtsA [Clostridium saccharobutylicum]|uniref:Cell division protein FtsA n=2 Tax=Clostridium saccharobutylicum TaxID=169679 RepID=A0A1S8NAW6_CLOSA|nr:cell division FtsA domain-containing protein [Clostridium saccharobutylicum]OOM13624.1 cell division protein FtsA [Clostridium saccharobutylicum]